MPLKFNTRFNKNFIERNKDKIIEIKISKDYPIYKYLQKDTIFYFYCEYLHGLFDNDTWAYLIIESVKIKDSPNYFLFLDRFIRDDFEYNPNTLTWNYKKTLDIMLNDFYLIIKSTDDYLNQIKTSNEVDKLLSETNAVFDIDIWNTCIPTKNKRILKLKSLNL